MAEAPQQNQFDDSGLKAAVSRVWSSEKAPDELRSQVAAALSSSNEPALRLVPSAPRRYRLIGLAAAAVILLAAGLLVNNFHHTHDLPTALAADLVQRHDKCCSAADHHMPGLDHDDYHKIGQELSEKLDMPILSKGLPGTWNFHGASICPVGNQRSGHLVFSNGPRSVSLFSLPRGVLSGSSQKALEFAEVSDRHPIAGFATVSGVYCVVGSSSDDSLTLNDVQLLRQQLRPAIIAADNARLAIAVSR